MVVASHSQVNGSCLWKTRVFMKESFTLNKKKMISCKEYDTKDLFHERKTDTS